MMYRIALAIGVVALSISTASAGGSYHHGHYSVGHHNGGYRGHHSRGRHGGRGGSADVSYIIDPDTCDVSITSTKRIKNCFER